MNVVFNVADAQKSLDFYGNVLGFKVEGDPLPGPDGKPIFGSVMWGSAMIMLDSSAMETVEPKGSGVLLHLPMEDSADIDAFYQKLKEHNVAVVEHIHDTFWGERTFTVRDIDGFALMFAKKITDVTFDQMAEHTQRGALSS